MLVENIWQEVESAIGNSNLGIFLDRFHESGVMPVAILAESAKLKV